MDSNIKQTEKNSYMKCRQLYLAPLAALLLFAACKKTDSLEPVRLFRPVIAGQLTADSNAIFAGWQKIRGATSYTVQLSRDTFRTIDRSVEVDTSVYLFTNLAWNQLYQVQVRANASDTVLNSRFSFLGAIKTPTSILNIPGPSDITENSVRLTWGPNNNAPLTEVRILLASDSSVVAQAALTATHITSQMIVLSGLQPNTAYIGVLYSAGGPRGYADFTTAAPLSGTIIDLRSITGVPSILADTILDADPGTTILLKRGEQYNIASSIALSKAVTIRSGSDLSTTEQARIFFTSNFNFVAGSNISYIDFIDVTLRGNAYGTNYVFNTTAGATVGRILFESCRAEIFRGVARLQSGNTTVSEFIVNNCIMDSLSNYGVLTVDNVACKAENISITNSTIYKAEKIITSRQNSTSVLIENVTINEAPMGGASNYYVDYSTSPTNNVANGITISNCIFGHGKWNNGVTTSRGVRAGAATAVNTSNNYRTADHVWAANEVPGAILYTKPASQIWLDPANGNFKIIDTQFPGRSNSGDPRWRM